MKKLRLVILPLLLAVLCGCATNGGPYYYGGTGYRVHNIGGLPVSGSMSVNATPKGVMFNPNIVIRPTYRDWKK
ncbi:hypothetical protein [Acidithiobacillus sp.]|uniref:hypothetical protein n=1 Tax=Acidithiobacillus sp. TaxID=1872118 RepID=UPI002586F00F|nr:hypothetical protein [Acidithiobacillus sp.]MDD5375074.1 hypothetical protein [Acidithiobacillus sp.]